MRPLTLVAALLAMTACAKADRTAADSAAAPAAAPATTADNADAKAAMVSNAIAANPAGADSILTANGYTRESFESEMFAIAADSSRSAAYAAAKKP
jgi:hypothetical protein